MIFRARSTCSSELCSEYNIIITISVIILLLYMQVRYTRLSTKFQLTCYYCNIINAVCPSVYTVRVWVTVISTRPSTRPTRAPRVCYYLTLDVPRPRYIANRGYRNLYREKVIYFDRIAWSSVIPGLKSRCLVGILWLTDSVRSTAAMKFESEITI